MNPKEKIGELSLFYSFGEGGVNMMELLYSKDFPNIILKFESNNS